MPTLKDFIHSSKNVSEGLVLRVELWGEAILTFVQDAVYKGKLNMIAIFAKIVWF